MTRIRQKPVSIQHIWRGMDSVAMVCVVLLLTSGEIFKRLFSYYSVSSPATIGLKAFFVSLLPVSLFCLYVFFKSAETGAPFWECAGLTPAVSRHALGLGLLSGMEAFFVSFLIGCLWKFCLSGIGVEDSLQTSVQNFLSGDAAAAALTACIAAPLTEELIFRTVIMQGLETETGNRSRAVLLSTLFFGFTHLNLGALPSVIVGGFYFASAFNRTVTLPDGQTYRCGLAASVTAHAVFNTAGLVCLAIIVS